MIRRTHLGMERLEARQMLAADFSLENGILEIEGTDERDIIWVVNGGTVYHDDPTTSEPKIFVQAQANLLPSAGAQSASSQKNAGSTVVTHDEQPRAEAPKAPVKRSSPSAR